MTERPKVTFCDACDGEGTIEGERVVRVCKKCNGSGTVEVK